MTKKLFALFLVLILPLLTIQAMHIPSAYNLPYKEKKLLGEVYFPALKMAYQYTIDDKTKKAEKEFKKATKIATQTNRDSGEPKFPEFARIHQFILELLNEPVLQALEDPAEKTNTKNNVRHYIDALQQIVFSPSHNYSSILNRLLCSIKNAQGLPDKLFFAPNLFLFLGHALPKEKLIEMQKGFLEESWAHQTLAKIIRSHHLNPEMLITQRQKQLQKQPKKIKKTQIPATKKEQTPTQTPQKQTKTDEKPQPLPMIKKQAKIEKPKAPEKRQKKKEKTPISTPKKQTTVDKKDEIKQEDLEIGSLAWQEKEFKSPQELFTRLEEGLNPEILVAAVATNPRIFMPIFIKKNVQKEKLSPEETAIENLAMQITSESFFKETQEIPPITQMLTIATLTLRPKTEQQSLFDQKATYQSLEDITTTDNKKLFLDILEKFIISENLYNNGLLTQEKFIQKLTNYDQSLTNILKAMTPEKAKENKEYEFSLYSIISQTKNLLKMATEKENELKTTTSQEKMPEPKTTSKQEENSTKPDKKTTSKQKEFATIATQTEQKQQEMEPKDATLKEKAVGAIKGIFDYFTKPEQITVATQTKTKKKPKPITVATQTQTEEPATPKKSTKHTKDLEIGSLEWQEKMFKTPEELFKLFGEMRDPEIFAKIATTNPRIFMPIFIKKNIYKEKLLPAEEDNIALYAKTVTSPSYTEKTPIRSVLNFATKMLHPEKEPQSLWEQNTTYQVLEDIPTHAHKKLFLDTLTEYLTSLTLLYNKLLNKQDFLRDLEKFEKNLKKILKAMPKEKRKQSKSYKPNLFTNVTNRKKRLIKETA